MKYKIMKSLVLSMIIVLAFSILAFADSMDMDTGIEKKVDGINVELSFKNGKAQTGNSDIMITLHDGNNQPILDAAVSATAEMDKSTSTDIKDSEPIAIEFENGDDQGQYMGSVNFTDIGKWIVKATIKLQGQEKNVDFDVDVVASAGPNWGIIGGFLGVMALIIIVAAVKKKQSARTAKA